MRELCRIWNVDYETFCRDDADDILQMLEKAERGEIEFMWVVGTNPVVSVPDRLRTERILRKLFVVVQDPFFDAETVEFADIYLPAAMWGEKTGYITNADQSVNLLEKEVEPPGQARSDLDIFIDLTNRLGFKDRDGMPLIGFSDSEGAFEEWRRVSKGRPCDYSGMTYGLLREIGAVRWPCNEKYPRGAERLYEDLKFNTAVDECEGFGVDFLTGTKTTRDEYTRRDPKGKAKLIPVHWRRPPNPVTDEFPLLLNTGRLVYHFHTRTKTARSEDLNRRAPAAYIEIHPEDAAPLGIELGDAVEINSPHGRTEAIAMMIDTVRRGEVFMPFHYGRDNETANVHTWYARDAVSKQPHFKSSPVSLRRISFGDREPWLLARRDELTGKTVVPFAAQTLGDTVNVDPTPAQLDA